MKVLVIIFSLLIPLTAVADTPNIFDRSKISSEEIFYGVKLCINAGKKLKPSIKPMTWYIYCNCSMDYYRIHRSLTKKALNTCAKFVMKKDFKMFPHFNKKKIAWTSSKILGNVALCVIDGQKRPIDKQLILPFCSCLTDARRYNFSIKKKGHFTKSQVEKCVTNLQFRFPSKFQSNGTKI